MFSIATIGMVVLALAIVFFVVFYQKKMLETRFKQQKLEVEFQHKMLQTALESQENERQRLAADLHDSIGAMLSTIRVSMLTLARTESLVPETVQQTKIMIDDTIDSVRRISRDLMPSTLQKFGLSQAIKEMCEQYATVSSIPITYLHPGDQPVLTKSHEVMVFRIVQELLNNAIKHAKCIQISVSLRATDSVVLEVEDNGIGFDFESTKYSSSGLGLFNIQNRIRMLGATLKYEHGKEKGTKVTVVIPQT